MMSHCSGPLMKPWQQQSLRRLESAERSNQRIYMVALRWWWGIKISTCDAEKQKSWMDGGSAKHRAN